MISLDAGNLEICRKLDSGQ